MASTVIDVRVPGDKSITHRALILGALAEGDSRITGPLDAADTRATAAALRALGVEISAGPPTVVRGAGLGGLRAPAAELDCANSGTVARLLLGALAGAGIEAVVTGDASLRRRPMARVTEPLTGCGARFRFLAGSGRLPIEVETHGGLTPIDIENARSSAQVKTAMLLAGLTAGVPVRVTERGRPRDHTELLLAAMGADISVRRADEGDVVALEPAGGLRPLSMRVPGDISSAAFFLALGALRGPVRVRSVGQNPTRTGALDVMRRMGVAVETERTGEEAGEPVGDVVAGPGPLRATTVVADEVPRLVDEIPVLAILAARAEGTTRFEGVAELRVKESDRIEALAANLRALGVPVDDGPDHLAVSGTDRPLRGTVDGFGDHRIAMAFGVLAEAPDCEIEIDGRDVVGISYPGFWADLERATRALEPA